MWRPQGWDIADYPVEYCEHIIGITNAFESGASAMHKEDVKWLIRRLVHTDMGYIFKMSDKEWQEFIKEVRYVL